MTYHHRAVLHVPFGPFSILFKHVCQQPDLEDLALLGQFASSLEPESIDGKYTGPTHPSRLCGFLYQTARVCADSDRHLVATSLLRETTAADNVDVLWDNHASEFLNDMGEFDPTIGQLDTSTMDLGEWYQGDQRLARLLDEGMPF